ncbi:uncharacterized protein BT62DRAFT_870818, partial [Guyanagaster necrorhizus]
RTLLQLIWSCSATIFVCTWLAVHPSVPGREGRGRLAIALRRTNLMLLAIIVPEIIIGWAAAQW